MTGALLKQPKTLGGTLLMGVSIVVGAMLWWFGRDAYEWVKAKAKTK